jgi:hypothetical protein
MPAFVLFVMSFVNYGKPTPWLNFGMLALFAGFVLLHWTRRHNMSADVIELGPPDPHSTTMIELARAEDYIDRTYRATEVAYFVKLVTQQPDYLNRVDEEVVISGRNVQFDTSLTFRGTRSIDRCAGDGPPSTGPASPGMLMPISRARKGILYDRFRAVDARGHELSTLPQWHVHGLMVVAVRGLLERALAETTNSPIAAQLSPQDRLIMLQLVKNTACAVIRPGAGPTADDDRLKIIGQLADSRFSPEWKDKVRSFCRSLIRMYLIVVEVARPGGDHTTISYSYQMEAERMVLRRDPKDASKRDRIRDRFTEPVRRAKHGLVPEVFDIAISMAFQSDSYHLTVLTTSNESYVFDHHLERLDSQEPLLQKDFGPNWYVRLYFEEGRSLAHLYIRRQAVAVVPPRNSVERTPDFDFKSIVQFREVPPGGLGPAVTVALVTALMVTYFALFRTGIDPNRDLLPGNTSSDFAVLILTVPALLAGAVGRGMSADRLVSVSLTAFYGLWVVITTSLAAVLLFILSANRQLPLEVRILPNVTVNLMWILLAGFSICTYLHLRRRKNEERKYYMQCLERAARSNKRGTDRELQSDGRDG